MKVEHEITDGELVPGTYVRGTVTITDDGTTTTGTWDGTFIAEEPDRWDGIETYLYFRGGGINGTPQGVHGFPARQLKGYKSEDPDKVKAEYLVTLLRSRGVPAHLHWDRSPWCARVPLLTVDPDTLESGDCVPSLFLFTEGPEDFSGSQGYKWHGALGQFFLEDDNEVDLHDVSIELIERTWLGDTEVQVARDVHMLYRLLTMGPNGLLALTSEELT